MSLRANPRWLEIVTTLRPFNSRTSNKPPSARRIHVPEPTISAFAATSEKQISSKWSQHRHAQRSRMLRKIRRYTPSIYQHIHAILKNAGVHCLSPSKIETRGRCRRSSTLPNTPPFLNPFTLKTWRGGGRRERESHNKAAVNIFTATKLISHPRARDGLGR